MLGEPVVWIGDRRPTEDFAEAGKKRRGRGGRAGPSAADAERCSGAGRSEDKPRTPSVVASGGRACAEGKRAQRHAPRQPRTSSREQRAPRREQPRAEQPRAEQPRHEQAASRATARASSPVPSRGSRGREPRPARRAAAAPAAEPRARRARRAAARRQSGVRRSSREPATASAQATSGAPRDGERQRKAAAVGLCRQRAGVHAQTGEAPGQGRRRVARRAMPQ